MTTLFWNFGISNVIVEIMCKIQTSFKPRKQQHDGWKNLKITIKFCKELCL